MDTFLTNEEVVALTGYKFKKCQCQALGRMGIKFLVNDRLGNPMVLRTEIESSAGMAANDQGPEINLEAMNEVING